MFQNRTGEHVLMHHFTDALPHKVSYRLKMALILFAVWTVIGVVLAIPGYLSSPKPAEAVAKVIEAWSWALLTPVIVLLDRRFLRSSTSLVQRAGILMALSVPFSIIETLLTSTLQYPFSGIWFNPFRVHDFMVYYFVNGWLTYSAIVGALMALEYYRRFLTGQVKLQQAEMRLLQSHLNTLRMQLEPHFLFNALNAISSEVVSNPELACDMIEDLGALLRLSLDYKDNVEIPLADEIILLEHYLAIQRVRFGDRIEIEISIPSDLMTVLVPCMLLQPIVENSIRHGISKRISGGQVVVSADRVGDVVEICVKDDGIGLPPEWRPEQAKGLGVRVTRERLLGLYPDIAESFEIRNRTTGGTEVIMRVPLRTVRMDDHEQAAA